MALTKVQTIGIETGVSLTGVTTVTTLNASTDTLSVGGTVNFGGNVSIAGTLTYEDVTNIDSVGIITARSDISIADKIIHTGDTNTAIRFPAADTFTVETGGAENARFTSSSITFKAPDGGSRYLFGETGNSASAELSLYNSSDAQKVRIAANNATFFNGGNVGIGENAPDNLLHLKSTASPAIELEQDDGTSYKGLIKLAGNDLEIKGSNGQMEFYNGSQDGDSSTLRMVIQNSGRIHLGTRDGNSNSTVFGVAKVNIVGPDPIPTSFTAGGCYLQIGGTESEANGLYPIGFGFRNSSATHVPAYIAYKTTSSSSNEKGALVFATRDVVTDTVPTERLRISSAGFIGAGTASPRRHFHIHNSASATVGFQMTNGNTGESNDSQGFQLKVGSDSHAEISQMENSDLRIFTNASERLRIASTGRVAIGNDTNNASPTALFQVKADDGDAADLYVGVFENLEATAGQSYGVNIRAGSNNTDHGLRVRNKANDATHFLVSGAGQVTKPLQTAFMAALNTNSSVTAGIGKIKDRGVGNAYTNVTLNTGNCYNSSTTTFTAPVDGVYVFSNQISASSDMPANAYLGAEFYKNGSRISMGWRRSHSQGYQRVTANIILSLSANDTVEPGIETAQAGTLNGGSTTLAQYNHFLGYLLH